MILLKKFDTSGNSEYLFQKAVSICVQKQDD